MTLALAYLLALAVIGIAAVFLLSVGVLVAWDCWRLWRLVRRRGLG